MKVHDILEGTPQEISDFFQNNGLNVADYFVAPTKPMSNWWVVLPCVLAIVAMTTLVFGKPLSIEIRTAVFISAATFSIWSGVAMQVRHKNAWATGVVIAGGILLSLVATGAMTPKEMYQEMKSLKSDGQK